MVHQIVFLLAAFGVVKANLPMLLSQEGYQSYGGRPGASGLSPGKGPSSHSLHHLSPSASEDSSFGHSHDFHHLPKAQHHLEPRPFRRPLDADDSHFVERHMPRSGQFVDVESPEGYSSQNHEAMNHGGGDGTPDDHYLHHPSEHHPPESHSSHGFPADHDQGQFQPGHSSGSFDDSHQPRFEESRYSEPESDFQSDHPAPLSRDEGEYHIQGPSHQFNYDEGGQLLADEFNAKHGSAPSPWMSGQLLSSQPSAGGSEFGLPSGTGVNIGVAPLDSATIGARSRQLGIRPPRMGSAIPNEAFQKFRPMTMSLRPRGPPHMSGLSHSEPMSFQPHMNAIAPPRHARLNFAHSMGGHPMSPPHSAMNFPPPRMGFRAEPHSNFDEVKSVGAFSEMMGGGGPQGYLGGIVFAYESYGSRSGSYGSSRSNRGSSGSYGRVIPLAVQSRRSIIFKTVPTSYDTYEPLTLEIPSSSQPLTLLMNTKSSPLNIQTSHQPDRGSYAETSSVDEPHIRKHTVLRPVHQYINEIVAPYRKVRMEVQPLHEERSLVVPRKAYGSNSGGYSSNGYSQKSRGYRQY